MPFRRKIVLRANTATTYDAVKDVVAPNLKDSRFAVTVDEKNAEFEIAYASRLSSSRYHFSIEETEEGTRLEAQLWLGGVMGPWHSVLRFWSHNRHLRTLLAGVERQSIAILAEDEAHTDVEVEDAEVEEGGATPTRTPNE